ncbi:DUF6132 family protein [uncultured Cytophaga sp.]|uniref:DUF6132 family protein n=1 Tax=uncultured Cytophaga sp. TaxID=160238 RepID=UPI0026221820|nr:DUF6132 family protein [uncultured Cytophaga sp.]
MMRISKTLRNTLLGIGLGALAGFLYWNFVGCSSGHCLIQSVWYNSTAYGAVMGGLLVNSFSSKKK